MYLNVGKTSAVVEVSHECKQVVLLKELYKVSRNISSIFSNWDAQVLIPETVFHEKSL